MFPQGTLVSTKKPPVFVPNPPTPNQGVFWCNLGFVWYDLGFFDKIGGGGGTIWGVFLVRFLVGFFFCNVGGLFWCDLRGFLVNFVVGGFFLGKNTGEYFGKNWGVFWYKPGGGGGVGTLGGFWHDPGGFLVTRGGIVCTYHQGTRVGSEAYTGNQQAAEGRQGRHGTWQRTIPS